jgi:hypothetical protein
MAKVVNGQPITAEARFQSQANPWLICGGKSDTEREFSKSIFSRNTGPPFSFIHSPIAAPYNPGN